VSHSNPSGLTRRDLMKKSGQIAAASALAGYVVPQVHAGASGTVRLALVGCGGRGTGAVHNALSVPNGQTRLAAMADVFEDRLNSSFDEVKSSFSAKLDVDKDHKFVGFDAYKHAMDTLKPGDVVILTTPPAFRWVHFTYAIQKGLNVFMEKPVTVDGGSSQRMFKLADEAEKKNLKVGVGLMCRHCAARRQLYDRIKSGEIGEIVTLRAYRMHNPVGSAFSLPRPAGTSELSYQIRRFHSFLWASGGLFSDFYIHHIDECCWMKDAWPIKAQALGGRNYRGANIDQNFDVYSVEYTFADGTKLFLEGRTMEGCEQAFASYAHGTQGCAVISERDHSPAHCRTYKNSQNVAGKNPTWRFQPPEPDPYELEWEHLLEAIRENKPYNEVKRGVEASLITAMGRMAAHTGQVITREQVLKQPEFAPDVDKLVMNGPPPIKANAEGKYPIPQPGKVKNREY
jgi:predicted dehydrogenase